MQLTGLKQISKLFTKTINIYTNVPVTLNKMLRCKRMGTKVRIVEIEFLKRSCTLSEPCICHDNRLTIISSSMFYVARLLKETNPNDRYNTILKLHTIPIVLQQSFL